MSDSPSTPEGTQVAPPEGASQEPEWIKLDPAKLTESIRELMSTNPTFNQVFNTEVGNHAARKYQPQLQQRERELEQERKTRRRLEILQMDEADITKKFTEDKDFASEYAELTHWKPQESSPSEADPTPLIQQAFLETEEYAKKNGVSEAFMEQLVNKAANGGYSDAHWSVGIRRMQEEVSNEIIRIKSTPSESTPAINPASLKGGADVTPASRGATQGHSFKTIAEFKALPTAEQKKILDTDDGLKAVEELARKG